MKVFKISLGDDLRALWARMVRREGVFDEFCDAANATNAWGSQGSYFGDG